MFTTNSINIGNVQIIFHTIRPNELSFQHMTDFNTNLDIGTLRCHNDTLFEMYGYEYY